jgi:hypothetical protein
MLQHSGNLSEVARLREKIDCEHQAASWAMSGQAIGTARHWFISRRMEHIGVYQEQLAVLVGEQASMAIVIEILENSPPQKREPEPAREQGPTATPPTFRRKE